MDTQNASSTANSDINEAALYKSLFENLPDLAYLIDKHCSFLNCNAHLLELLELHSIDKKSPGALYKLLLNSTHWSEKQVQDIKTKDIEAILSGTSSINESTFDVVEHEGETQHFLVFRIPIFDNTKSVSALLVIFKDLCEIKNLQDQVNSLQKQLQAININANLSTTTTNLQEKLDRPLNILVVEDNIIAQKAAQSILMKIDCSVEVANSESQLSTMFIPGKYDMIFMDIGLEETSGYMLAKKIRAQEKNTEYHVPIIALTGYKADMLTTDCGYYQIEGAITKPLTIEQAQQLIQRYIFHIDIPVKGLKLATPPD